MSVSLQCVSRRLTAHIPSMFRQNGPASALVESLESNRNITIRNAVVESSGRYDCTVTFDYVGSLSDLVVAEFVWLSIRGIAETRGVRL